MDGLATRPGTRGDRRPRRDRGGQRVRVRGRPLDLRVPGVPGDALGDAPVPPARRDARGRGGRGRRVVADHRRRPSLGRDRSDARRRGVPGAVRLRRRLAADRRGDDVRANARRGDTGRARAAQRADRANPGARTSGLGRAAIPRPAQVDLPTGRVARSADPARLDPGARDDPLAARRDPAGRGAPRPGGSDRAERAQARSHRERPPRRRPDRTGCGRREPAAHRRGRARAAHREGAGHGRSPRARRDGRRGGEPRCRPGRADRREPRAERGPSHATGDRCVAHRPGARRRCADLRRRRGTRGSRGGTRAHLRTVPALVRCRVLGRRDRPVARGRVRHDPGRTGVGPRSPRRRRLLQRVPSPPPEPPRTVGPLVGC
jgi:hypothetical protein